MAKKRGRKRPSSSGGKVSVEKLVSSFLRIRKQVDKLRLEVRQHEESDLPSYVQWMEERFGKDRAEFEEMVEERDRLAGRLHEVDMMVILGIAGSEAAAYRAVTQAEAKEEERAGEPAMESGFEEFTRSSEFDEMLEGLADLYIEEGGFLGGQAVNEEDFERVKERMREGFEHMANGNRPGFERTMMRLGADESPENVRKAKELFRGLAKRLHPDHNGHADEEMRALWDDALTAYEALNTGALEAVELRCRIASGESFGRADVPLLKRAVAELTQERNCLRELAVEAKSEPSWGFASLNAAARVQREIELAKEIRKDRAELERALTELRAEDRRLRERALRRPKPKPKRKPKVHRPAREAVEQQAELPF